MDRCKLQDLVLLSYMQQPGMETVGVIGLGIIGSRVAQCLRDADYHVYVWNRSPKSEPNFVASPGEIAKLAKRIQIFVANGEALVEVVRAMAGDLTSEHVVINNCTADPESVVEAYQIAKEAGARFLDAPFTGSKEAAAQGALVYYVGGDSKVLERVAGILEVSSKQVLPVGRVGEATVLKIATNMISAATVEVLSEAYGLVKAAGMDPDRLRLAVENNACGSTLTSMKLPSIIEGDYDTHFSLKHMFKDAQYALSLAKDLQVDLPALSTTANVMYRTMKEGHSDADYSVVARRFQK